MNTIPLVLILGAGASRGVRSERELAPPVGSRLGTYLRDWLDENRPRPGVSPSIGWEVWEGDDEGSTKALTRELELLVLREQDPPDGKTAFEGLMDQWWQSERREDAALVRLMSRLVALSMLFDRRDHWAFEMGADLYDELLPRIVGDRPTIVVTVNYDVLIEEAFQRQGKRYSHPGILGDDLRQPFVSSGQGSITPLYKLHGSVSWWAEHGFSGSTSLEEARVSTKPVEILGDKGAQTYATGVYPDRDNLLASLEISTIGMPVVAVYGTGKHLPWNRHHVDAHRRCCLDQIQRLEVAEVIVAGLRPVSYRDDHVLWRVFRAIGRRKNWRRLYVGDDPVVRQRFKNLGFVPAWWKIEEWIRAAG